jgi:hypothetical protein
VSKRGQLTDVPNKSVHQFTGNRPGKRKCGSLYQQGRTPYNMLYFASVITLLVEKTNRYCHQYLDTLDNGSSPLPETEIFLFLTITVQMGHDICDSLADYWSMTEQFHTPFFYSTTMKRDTFFHIIQLLNFSNKDSATDKKLPKL